MSDYQRIARALAYLQEHAERQPGLAEVAAQLQLSPFHFQRLFCRWAGTTPKRFQQMLTLARARERLPQARSLLALSESLSLSSSSRLHEHFVRIEAMTPDEYRRQGAGLTIEYGIHEVPFGTLLIACTGRGICRAAFIDGSSMDASVSATLDAITRCWPRARLQRNDAAGQRAAETIRAARAPDRPLSLHLRGTNFQLAIWRALLTIPLGTVTSYATLAAQIDQPRAARAVGNAVAANPVAWLIPCHRVILGSGAIGNYHWGGTRKQLIQLWEMAQRSDCH